MRRRTMNPQRDHMTDRRPDGGSISWASWLCGRGPHKMPSDVGGRFTPLLQTVDAPAVWWGIVRCNVTALMDDLTAAEARLKTTCEANGKDFLAAIRMARQLVEGRLSMEQCIALVGQTMGSGPATLGKVTIPVALESFKEQLASLDEAEAKAARAVNDIKRHRSELQKVVNALDEIIGNPGAYDCPDCGRPCRNLRALSNHRSRMHKPKLEAV